MKRRTILPRSFLAHFIALAIFSLISCGDDDACPDVDQFSFESSAIYNCDFTTDSIAFNQALMGSWAWEYGSSGWTLDVDCMKHLGDRVEFKANNVIQFMGSNNFEASWKSRPFHNGNWRGLVLESGTYPIYFHICGSKLLFLDSSLADSNSEIFSKE